MNRYTIYTYKGVKEFEALYNKCDQDNILFMSFKFKDTLDLLQKNSHIVLDITNVIPFIMTDNSNIYSVEINLSEITDQTKVVVDEKYSDATLSLLRNIFDEKEELNLLVDENANINLIDEYRIKRKTIYTYNNLTEINDIIKYCEEEKFLYISFSKLNNEIINKSKDNNTTIFVDMTNIILASEHTPEVLYISEQLLNNLKNYTAVIREDLVEKALNNYFMIFDNSSKINELLPQINSNKDNDSTTIKNDNSSKITITNIDKESLDSLKTSLDSNLFGHNYFKKEFDKKIDDYIMLNKLNRKKVLSVFLLGGTGLGKTEVARIIAKSLNPLSDSFIKINFGNYSSQDALNSLIGSPKGYVGCESGELSTKLLKNKTGIILCDEFEKANPLIFNFFLELLEDGKFTDSMSNEYDLDGFIIIFTSNISEEQFYKEIPKEFQSRIDFVCEFMPLSKQEKKQYAISYLENLIKDININIKKIDINSKQCLNIIDIDYDTINNIRDIKRKIEKKLFERLDLNIK